MHTIEIDFEVFKKLTALRETEAVTYNDVLRKLLGINSTAPSSASTRAEIHPFGIPNAPGSWTTKGVTFPAGTEFRTSYKGEIVYGRVEAGALAVNDKRYESPSAAAAAITGTAVNGWIFWECRKPGSTTWQMIKSLRKGA